jgi:hypothetical protein
MCWSYALPAGYVKGITMEEIEAILREESAFIEAEFFNIDCDGIERAMNHAAIAQTQDARNATKAGH